MLKSRQNRKKRNALLQNKLKPIVLLRNKHNKQKRNVSLKNRHKPPRLLPKHKIPPIILILMTMHLNNKRPAIMY